MGGIRPQRQEEPLEQEQHAAPAEVVRARSVEVGQDSPADRRVQAGRRKPGARPMGKVAHKDEVRTMRRHLLPSHWWFAALPLVSTVPICGIITRSWPPAMAVVTALVGIAAALLSRPIAMAERSAKGSTRLREAIGWLTIVVPFAAFAYAMVVWNMQAGLAWPWIIAGVISMNTMAFSLLTERPLQQASCLLASWGTVALGVGTFETLGGFLFGLACVAAIWKYQSRVNLARLKTSQMRERERNRAEEILNDYEDTGQGWFWETDRRGHLSYISASVAATLRRKQSDLIQRPFSDLFELGSTNTDGERTLTFHLSSRSSFQELGVKANVSGEDRWWSVSGRPAYDSFGNFLGFRGSGTDLTEKKRSQESVQRLAQYDSLTGLANRFQMQQTLEKVLSAPIEAQRECSVFLLDLDRFKQVNDTLGHPAGDALLKQVAQRLERTVGKDGRVGRLGGDEFEVILPGRVARERLAQLAQEIISSLSQPYSIEGQRVTIGASVGIAVSPDNGDTSEAIIRNADLALYAAKDGGRGRYHFFSDDLHSAAEERAKLEEDLRDAIAHGGLELFYQPVVHAQDNRIAGFEALLRWNHPMQGWLSPEKFIPIAEDTGLIAAIDEWAIRTACNDLAHWPAHIRCAVNVSPLQFANPQLPAIVTNAVASAQIDPSRLELELTESVFLNDDAGTEAMFTALKRVGVRLALDDFGTGYSSLGYLKKAPFDKIKIDQSFVRGATQPGSRNGAIIASISSLAYTLGMDTTAEGVETLDELELVRSLGCSHIQGYIFSKAVPFEKASAFIANGPTMKASGYRSARPPRQSMLRKVVLEHSGEFYNGTIRNISQGGAMIEGLWNVPPGTRFNIAISTSMVLGAVSIWSEDQRMGVKFDVPLELDAAGKVAIGGDDDKRALRRPESDAA